MGDLGIGDVELGIPMYLVKSDILESINWFLYIRKRP